MLGIVTIDVNHLTSVSMKGEKKERKKVGTAKDR